MTTNVRDSRAGDVACDSRWTWDLRAHGIPNQLLLDDSGYEKLVRYNNCVVMFAGNSTVIDVWKASFAKASYTGEAVDWGSLPVNGMAISTVAVGSGRIIYEYGHEISLPEASFAGTGSYAAAGCWSANNCARTAVETAKGSDMHTGGVVRFLNFKSGDSNLVADRPLSELIPQFMQRGKMMANTNSPVTFTNVSANDEALKQAMEEAVAQGSGPAAPCDAVFNEWPEAEKTKLAHAMEEFFSH
jgi:hypothetical protein